MSREIPPLKTYSHLAGQRRVPTEYEIVTSRLLYHGQRGFEVDVPVADFYRRFQTGSPLAVADWERFVDPRETTYTKYVELQARQETHVAALFRALEAPEHAPSPERLLALEHSLGPLRFFLHGLQMLAAHVGQMAPAGRIAIVALFQAADEMRRVQGIAYRMAQLRRLRPGFGARSRALWQEDPAWQPLRRLVETALVAYDFGEALTALNLCIKPVLDGLWNAELGRLERARGAFPFGEVLASFDEDARWHREWTAALFGFAFAERPSIRAVVQAWIARWAPPVWEAASALAPALLREEAAGALERAESNARRFLLDMGLEPR